MSLLLQTLDQSAWGVDPRTYPGCALWLDANDLSTLYTDLAGTTRVDPNWNSGAGFYQSVRFWADKSSNSNHARSYETFNSDAFSRYPITLGSPNVASGIYMGTYNAFTGATSKGGTFDLCGTLLPQSGSAVSIFVVADPPYRSLIPQRAHMIYSQGTLGTNQAVEVYFNYASSKMNTVAGMFGGGGVTNTVDSSFYRVISIVNGGSSMSGWMDGSAFTTATAAVTTSTTGSRAKIGGRTGPDNAGLVLTGRIGEIIVYSNAVTTTQRQIIEGYLYNKWKKYYTDWSPNPVAGPWVPTTHPYFSRPPFSTQFNPRSIANCITWLDATDSTGYTLATGSTTNLSTVLDKSGTGATLTLNGPPKWTPDGIGGQAAFDMNSAYMVGTFSAGNICTRFVHQLFAVAQWDSIPGDGSAIVGLSKAATGNSTHFYRNDVAFGAYRSVVFNSTNVFVAGVNYTSFKNPVILTGYYSGSLVFLGSNAAASNNSAPAGVAYPVGSNGTHFFVGTDSGGGFGTFRFPGKLGELIIYNRVLNTVERELVEGYLAWKWNIGRGTDGFAPMSLGNCTLWLDGADTTTNSMTFSGNNITVWKDKSGNGKDFTASGTGSTYNTNPPGLLFTTNLYTSTHNASITTTETMFLVFKANSVAANGFPVSSSASGGRGLGFKTSGEFGVVNTGIVWGATITGLTTTPVYMGISIISNNGTNTSFSRDGFNPVTVNGITAFSGTTTTRLGREGTSLQYSGVICEVIAYSTVLSASQQQRVAGYLMRKWGIANTGTSHPFYYTKVPPNLAV